MHSYLSLVRYNHFMMLWFLSCGHVTMDKLEPYQIAPLIPHLHIQHTNTQRTNWTVTWMAKHTDERCSGSNWKRLIHWVSVWEHLLWNSSEENKGYFNLEKKEKKKKKNQPWKSCLVNYSFRRVLAAMRYSV